MKRVYIYIGIAFSLVSCAANAPEIASGDLLFMQGKTSAMNCAIADATRDEDEKIVFTHVGILVRKGGADSVLEATDGGVRKTALDDFLARAAKIKNHPAVVAMRLRDTTGTKAAIARAEEQKRLPYDYAYLPDNGKFYCSELVWESFLASDGTHLFPARPMNFRAADGTMPPFWAELFEKSGNAVPEGVPGTNPQAMSQESQLKEVYRWF